MAISIKFQKTSKSKYHYSDLSLDLQFNQKPIGASNLTRKAGDTDLKTDFDEHAIANSLRNLFSTKPKQRILDPEYGLRFEQFLFEKVTIQNARLIARKIEQGVERFEPRVKILNIEVIANEVKRRYEILLNLTIPSINKNIVYSSFFGENGFNI